MPEAVLGQADILDPERPLWRYMQPAKFLALISTQALWLARLDCLGDGFEGSIATAPPVEGIDPAPNPQRSAWRQAMRYVTYANCWTVSEIESVALWRIYAPGSDGVAVATTVDRLRRAMSAAPLNWQLGKVQYRDYATYRTDDPNDFGRWLFSKRTAYRYEEEVRVLAYDPADVNGRRLDALSQVPSTGVMPPRGHAVKVDLGDLITDVRVSPESHSSYVDVLRDVVRHFDLGWTVSRSELDGDPTY